jgi:hypothetical protein
MMNIKIESTSLKSAKGEDIELRGTKSTRLIFRPEIVSNIKQPEASVRGTFIFQKKKISGDWIDYKTFDLSKLKDEEWIKLEIKSGELYRLITKLDEYYQIYEKYGIIPGKTEFVVTNENIAGIITQITSEPGLRDSFFQSGGTDLLIDIMQWISETQHPNIFIEKLKDLNVDSLETIHSLLGLTKISRLIELWQANIDNADEEFWQKFFKNHPWVISQVFSYPVVLFKDKAYIGGKSISNKGGNVIDFLYKNKLTDNLILVEIKAPTTKLLSKEYRDNVYSVSTDLSGAINQILNYKDGFQKEYNLLAFKTSKTSELFNPKCLLIIGNQKKEIINKNLRRSFELYRSEMKSVEIITFDELFEKVRLIINMFQEGIEDNFNGPL